MIPERAKVNLTMPKTRLFDTLHADALFRRIYEERVSEFIWMYSLDPERIHTQATSKVSKIDVVFLILKKKELPKIIIQKIDAKLPKNVRRVYFCSYNEEWSMVLNYRPENWDEAPDGGYFFTTPYDFDPWNFELPNCYNLTLMYTELVKRMVCVMPHNDESLDDLVIRDYQVRQFERQAGLLKSRMEKEIQPKQKIEMNIQLQNLTKSISRLKT